MRGEELGVDRDDLDLSERLAMPLGKVITFAAAEFESSDLRGLELLDYFSNDASAGYGWGTDDEAVTFAMSEDLIKGSPFALFDFQFLNIELVAHGDFVLLAAGFEDCVCHNELKRRGRF